MKIFIKLIVLLILFACNSRPENQLFTNEETSAADTAMLRSTYQSALDMMDEQPDSAVILMRQALKKARKMDYKKGVIVTSSWLGKHHTNRFDSLIYYTRLSMDIARATGDSAFIALSYLNLSIVHNNFRSSTGAHRKEMFKSISIPYLDSAYQIASAIKDTGIMIDALIWTAQNYLALEDHEIAKSYIEKAKNYCNPCGGRTMEHFYDVEGQLYASLNQKEKAIENYKKLLNIYEKEPSPYGIAFWRGMIALELNRLGKYEEAEEMALSGYNVARENSLIKEEKDLLEISYTIQKEQGQFKKALVYHERLTAYLDSIYAVEAEESISKLNLQLQTQRDREKIALLQRDKKIQEQEKSLQHILLLSLLGGLLSLCIVAYVVYKGKKRSDNLLLNILPHEIAQELKEKGKADARDFEMVSILFTDFKSFTEQSEKLSATDLVSEINHCFEAFDGIMEKYSIEKIKTIGDAYMAAGGLPVPTDDSVKNTVLAALEMQAFIANRKAEHDAKGEPAFEMRVGIHTGPVVAGIVGVKKFQYDIWGDTVNTASRMESSGEVGKVNISQATYVLLKNDPDFAFESRGKIEAKGKGEMEMYFVSMKA